MTKKIIKQLCCLFCTILSACAWQENIDLTKPQIPISTPANEFTLPAFPTVLPLQTLIPTHISTITPSALPKFPLDGYIILFKKEEDLYFQDGESEPIKLVTIKGEGTPPYFLKISDDNQKIVFYHDDGNMYSINLNGKQKQVLIPNNWLSSFGNGVYIGSLDFVPKTHLMFFEILDCQGISSISLCSTSIFIVNTDTGEIKKLSDLGFARQKYNTNIQNNIRFSPDGTMVAVGTTEGVKIYSLDGEIIYQEFLSFTPSSPDTPFPVLFWLPGSDGLILALPDKIQPDPYFVHGTSVYTIWRYMLDKRIVNQISFTPPVSGDLEVSPDGNWIVYGGTSPASLELYLGNLLSGDTKYFANSDLRKIYKWSPNSKYFIYGSNVVISFDKPPLESVGCSGSVWIDSNHFLCIDIVLENSTFHQKRYLVAQIQENGIFYYDLGFSDASLVAIKPQK